MYNSAKPVNRVLDIVNLNQVLRALNEENVCSALALLINNGKVINIFNISCTKQSTSLSHFCNISIAHNVTNKLLNNCFVVHVSIFLYKY